MGVFPFLYTSFYTVVKLTAHLMNNKTQLLEIECKEKNTEAQKYNTKMSYNISFRSSRGQYTY